MRQRDYPRKAGTIQFVIHAHDKPDGSVHRAPPREAHHEYLHRYRNLLFARGPVLDDDGNRMIGSLLILDVAGKAEAVAFWAGVPFNRAGVYEWTTMERWRFGHV